MINRVGFKVGHMSQISRVSRYQGPYTCGAIKIKSRILS